MRPKNIIAFTITILMAISISAQESLNKYKYVIVPKKYDFLKSEDKYQLNSLTKFLFDKEGFITLFDDEPRPNELAIDPCMGLTTKVHNQPGLFSTKLIIELVNCRNETVFTSPEGKSKEKDYKKAYHEALRNAFSSISALNYKYLPTPHDIEIVKHDEKIPEPPTPPSTELTPKIVEKQIETVVKPIVKPETQKKPIYLLYAQPNALGYQLVDSTPKVIFILLKTDSDTVFILKDKNGILIKLGKRWIAEYYKGDELIKEELNIKF